MGCGVTGDHWICDHELNRIAIQERYLGVFDRLIAVLSDNSVTLELHRSAIDGSQTMDAYFRVGRLSSATYRA